MKFVDWKKVAIAAGVGFTVGFLDSTFSGETDILEKWQYQYGKPLPYPKTQGHIAVVKGIKTALIASLPVILLTK